MIELSDKQIESAKESIKEEIKLYNQGRNELNSVILAQDSLSNIQLAKLQQLIDYHRLWYQLLAYQNDLLAQFNIKS